MKFLVLALCVCAASAASFDYKPFKPYQAPQKYPSYRQPVPAPAVVPKAAYEAAKFVASPFVAAAAVVPVSPAVKTFVEVAAKPVYNTAEAVAAKAYEPIRATPIVSKTGYLNEADAEIVRFESDVGAEGYEYGYETKNGIVAQSSGNLKNVDGTDYLVSQGYYEYVAPDGTPVKVEYVADENGFQPRSNLLPVGPPIPEAIVRSLEYLRTHAQKPEY